MFLQHRRPAARDGTFRAMSGAELGLAVSVFLACAVECVEALTIVLAVGGSRSWSSALSGVRAALVALAALVAVLGAGLRELPRRRAARADRRAAAAVRAAMAAQGRAAPGGAQGAARRGRRPIARSSTRRGRSRCETARSTPTAFAVAGKGVLLEGLEVALIVVTFGADHHRTGIAAAAAGRRGAGRAARGRRRSQAARARPENTMKYAVGVMLTLLRHLLARRGRGRRLAGWRRDPARADRRRADVLARRGRAAAPRAGARRRRVILGVPPRRRAPGVGRAVAGCRDRAAGRARGVHL